VSVKILVIIFKYQSRASSKNTKRPVATKLCSDKTHKIVLLFHPPRELECTRIYVSAWSIISCGFDVLNTSCHEIQNLN